MMCTSGSICAITSRSSALDTSDVAAAPSEGASSLGKLASTSAPRVRHWPAIRSPAGVSLPIRIDTLKSPVGTRAITPDTWHMRIWCDTARPYRGNRVSWCMNPLIAVDEMVSTASALVSTLLAPPYMYPMSARPTCSALLMVAVRIEKNWALLSLAWHMKHRNWSSGHSRYASLRLSRLSCRARASISVNTAHAPWIEARPIRPVCLSRAPIPHRGRLWCTGVPTQLRSAHFW